ncbi:DMT family transporter [Helicobacter burdigaliensis]|uniref:DMT family transporter n=1 Tax=Helicobacter burdigaliensis TaxID=2315334 RepID=UPI000EF65EEA|nr:DMT family transporter [Helicobacter burdigaliensis]
MRLNTEQIGVLWISSASIAYGIMPIWTVLAQKNGFGSDFILFFRFFFSALLLLAWIRFKKIPLKLPKIKLWHFFFLGGFLYTAQAGAYLESLRFIPATLSVLIYHIYPIIVALIAIFFLKDRLKFSTLLCLVLCFLGLVLILQIPQNLTLSYFGIALSLIGALFYALYVIFSKNITFGISSVVCSFYICLFASFVMFIIFTFKGGIEPASINSLGILSLLGLTFISTLFSMMAYFLGISKLGVTKTAILGMIEPLVAVLLSLIILKESLNLWQWSGAFLIIFGTLILFIKK